MQGQLPPCNSTSLFTAVAIYSTRGQPNSTVKWISHLACPSDARFSRQPQYLPVLEWLEKPPMHFTSGGGGDPTSSSLFLLNGHDRELMHMWENGVFKENNHFSLYGTLPSWDTPNILQLWARAKVSHCTDTAATGWDVNNSVAMP